MQEKDLPAVMALSYLGDAAYSFYVRMRLVKQGISHAKDLNRLSLLYVTAKRQAQAAKRLLPLLNDAELGVYKRAFNHKGLSHPHGASYGEYRAATGFEAVLGALSYLGEKERLAFLLDAVHRESEQITINAKDECEDDTEN